MTNDHTDTDAGRGTADELTATALAERPLIYWRGDSVRHVLVSVTAPTAEAASGERAPLNLALVLDASGSMEGEPIEAARRAADLVVARLRDDDRLSLIAFDSAVRTLLDGEPQTQVGRARAQVALAGLQAGSSTFLSGGYLAGCHAVGKAMEAAPAARHRVVLFSDGMANAGIVDPAQLGEYASGLHARGLLSSAVGIGAAYSTTQLEAIATHGGGQMHHAARPEEIAEVVLAEFEETGRTTADACSVVLSTPPGVRAEVVGDWPSRVEPGELRCELGGIVGGRTREVALKLTMPAGTHRDSVEVGVRCEWRPSGAAGARIVDAGRVAFTYASGSDCLQQPRESAVAARVAALWQVATVRQAMDLNQRGLYQAAAEFLRQELHFFRRFCAGLEEARELVRDLQRLLLTIERPYEAGIAKEMMTASRKRGRAEPEHRAGMERAWHEHIDG
jgi:Ca-activated chloride channel family protein